MGWLLPITVVAVILAGNPQSASVVPKNFFVLLAGVLSLGVLAVRILGEQKTELVGGRLFVCLAASLVLIVASSLKGQPNPLQALVRPELPLISLIVFLLIAGSVLRTTDHLDRFIKAIFIGTVLLSAWLLVSLSALQQLKQIQVLGQFLSSNLNFWEILPLGVAGLLVGRFYLAATTKKPGKYWLGGLIALVAVGLFASAKNQLPAAGTQAPLSLSWSLAMDQLKSLDNTVFGVGLSRYGELLTQNRPVWLNETDDWQKKYTTGFNAPLTMLSTSGMIVLAALAFLTYYVYQSHKNNIDLDTKRSELLRQIFLVFLAANLLLPTSVVNFSLLGLTLLVMILDLKQVDSSSISRLRLDHEALPVPKQLERFQEVISRNLWALVGLAGLALSILGLWFAVRSYLAEQYWSGSQTALTRDRGIDAYESVRTAVWLYPFDPTYRISYSLTNMALLNRLIPELGNSEEDQGNLTGLIVQAIREAKAATLLAPRSAVAWHNLAIVYRQLIGLADNAEEWSLGAYAQTVRLDPRNPQWPMDLGGIYLDLGDHQSALTYFNQVLQLKTNWPKAYYNLFLTFSRLGNEEDAQQILFRASQLSTPEDPDYRAINEALKKF